MTVNARNLLIIVFGLLMAALGTFGQTDDTAKILAQVSPGLINVVALSRDKQEIARGTAVAIAPNIAVTSYHLVSLAATCTGYNFKKKSVDINGIVAVNKALDLALIKYDGKVTPLNLSGFENISAGKKIYAVGANESGDFIVASGEVRNIFSLGPNDMAADSTLSTPEQFSGGAAVDDAGKIVGIFQILDKRLRFVIAGTSAAAIPKTGKETPWKSWMQEDYSGTIENAWLCGRLYAWGSDLYGAQRYLEKVTKAQPDNLEAWKMLAKGYDTQRDYQSAIAAYTKVGELDPRDADAFFGLGQILTRMQRSSEAIPALEKALALNPEKKEAFFTLGNAYEDSHEFQKAADAYEKYLAANPANAWQAYLRLGMSRLNANQFDQAAAALEEARKAQPDNQNITYNLAQSYQKAGKLDKAEEVYKSLAQLSPKDAAIYYSYILNMYSVASQWAKALEASQKLIEIKPNDEQSLYNSGFLLQQMQKYPDAIAAYKKVIAVNPNYDKAWFQTGYCQYEMKNYKETIVTMQKFTSLAPNDFYGWLYLGMCYMQIKDHNKALEPMKKAVEIDPSNSNALFNLGVIYLNLKARYDALEIVKKLQAIDPDKAAKLRSYIK